MTYQYILNFYVTLSTVRAFLFTITASTPLYGKAGFCRPNLGIPEQGSLLSAICSVS